MPSPFPGMNPWLEQECLWRDVQIKMLVAISERLVPQLSTGYFTLIQMHSYLLLDQDAAHPAHEVERVPYLEIRHVARGDLVTVLELLSPTNKQGVARRQYLAKRQELLNSETNVVEIDLLRAGRPMPDTSRPDCDYSVVVSRWRDRPRAGFWPIGLRDPLPTIPIPLRQPDADARVDLQACLHHVHDAAGYANFIYRGTPSPALRDNDLAWTRQFLPI